MSYIRRIAVMLAGLGGAGLAFSTTAAPAFAALRSRERRFESCRGAGQKINSNTLTILVRYEPGPVTCETRTRSGPCPRSAPGSRTPAAEAQLSGET